MKFQHHLFISYAHVDNKPTSDDAKGWVTRFHECLESYLSHSVGEEARIWRDAKLRGNDEFGPEIEENLPRSAILLSILSPRYFESDWCIREVNNFCSNAKQSAGLKVGNKVRVFRVLTKSLDRKALEVFPDLSDKSTGYEFFQNDERDRESWLDPAMGSGEEYRRQIYYLADEIAELIRGLEKAAQAEVEPQQPAEAEKSLTVYLAECSYDQRDNREKVAGSLRGHGYRILPEDRLPEFETDYIEQAEKLIDECDLSVHIIGNSYGVVPDGPSGKSNVVLQNELAAQRSASSGMKRLIWISRDVSSEKPRQQSFLESLRQTTELQRGADLIEGDLETLKGNMHKILLKIQKQQAEPVPESVSKETTVYLVCTQRDRGSTIELRKFLKQQNYQVKIPVFEGDAATMRKANEANFNAAHAVILFYGSAEEAWRATTENELTRMAGLQEKAPLSGRFIYLDGPESVDKSEILELEEEGVINGLSGFSEEIMLAFMQAVPA